MFFALCSQTILDSGMVTVDRLCDRRIFLSSSTSPASSDFHFPRVSCTKQRAVRANFFGPCYCCCLLLSVHCWCSNGFTVLMSQYFHEVGTHWVYDRPLVKRLSAVWNQHASTELTCAVSVHIYVFHSSISLIRSIDRISALLLHSDMFQSGRLQLCSDDISYIVVVNTLIYRIDQRCTDKTLVNCQSVSRLSAP